MSFAIRQRAQERLKNISSVLLTEKVLLLKMCFICLLLYGLLYLLSEKLSIFLKAPHAITVPVFGVYWTVLFFCLYRKNLLKKYGVCRAKHHKPSAYVIYVPFLLLPTANLMLSFQQLTVHSYVCPKPTTAVLNLFLLLFSALGEEYLFRGFLL